MRLTIEWIDHDQMTRAHVTKESPSSRWWRRRYISCDVYRDPHELYGRRQWRFAVGNDRVLDHDRWLAGMLELDRDRLGSERDIAAAKAKLINPWAEVVELPAAKVVKP